jgi:peptidoglycan/xylan/chitin deacetylase (PgdA/CDA1 family)
VQLSRSRKVVLLGVVLLIAGLTGHASADATRARLEPRSAAAKRPPAKPATKPKAAAKPKIVSPAQAKAARAEVRFGPSGSRSTTGSKAVALTFDDGPDLNETPRILKLLAQQHVHATFCLVGKNVARHPALVRQIVAGGHTICDHTWNHSLTIGKTPVAEIRADLQRTNDAIHQAAPNAEIKYFRAPGGNFTPRLVAVAKQLGMTSIYWKVDPRDWDHPKGQTHQAHQNAVVWRVSRNTHKGSIVLSHDFAQPDTIAAYGKLLPWLKKRYQLVALP